MTENNYQFDFKNALSALEDIQILSDYSLTPLISNAYFYLTELKRKADLSGKSSEDKIQCDLIEKLLKEKLSNIVYEFFGNKNKFKSYQYVDEADGLDIRKWNLVLENIPEFLTVVSMFSYHGLIDINLSNCSLKVSGVILNSSHIEISRKLIYAITRKLLRNKLILTYKLTQISSQSPYRLELNLDFSHDKSFIYKIPIDKTKCGGSGELALGLADNLFRYKISKEKAIKLEEHHVFEIYSTLNTSFNIRKIDGYDPDINKKDIIHFPFIFRPFSIILPVKGSLEDFRMGKQDVSNNYEFVDFFSFFDI